MDKPEFSRCVKLPSNVQFVPVSAVRALLLNAMAASLAHKSDDEREDSELDFGFRIDDDYIMAAVLKLRDAGRLRVFGHGGLGHAVNPHPTDCTLRQEDLRTLLAEEFNTDLELHPTEAAAGAAGSPAAESIERRQDRRLRRLRELGADRVWRRGEWKTTGTPGALKALCAEERAAQRRPFDPKRIRGDLTEAAERERARAREGKTTGWSARLGG